MATMNRKPAQDDIEEADDALGNTDGLDLSADSIDLEGTYAPEASVKEIPVNKAPASSGFAPDEKAVLARGLTGAAPALLGFLFGSSPKIQAQNIEQGQQYYANGTPKKLVMTVGDDGSPVYTDSRDAVGQKAYQKPARMGAGGMPKATSFYNPDSGLVEKGFADPITRKFFNAAGKEVPGAQEYVPTDFKEASTAGGTKTFLPLNPVSGGLKAPPVAGPLGEADAKGMGDKQYNTALDLSKQAPKEFAPLQQKIANANSTMSLLVSPDKAVQQQGMKQAVQYLQDAKINAEAGGVQIAMPQGFLEKWSEIAQRAATGRASSEEVGGLLTAVQQVAASQNEALRTMGQTIKQAAGPEASNMMNNNIHTPSKYAPKMPTVTPSQHPQTSLMIRKAADILANPNSTEDQKNDAKKILQINGRMKK